MYLIFFVIFGPHALSSFVKLPPPPSQPSPNSLYRSRWLAPSRTVRLFRARSKWGLQRGAHASISPLESPIRTDGSRSSRLASDASSASTPSLQPSHPLCPSPAAGAAGAAVLADDGLIVSAPDSRENRNCRPRAWRPLRAVGLPHGLIPVSSPSLPCGLTATI